MNCTYSLSQFIHNVYEDLGNPSSYSISRLSGWFLDDSNIGKLNNLIGTQISGICLKDGGNNITGYNLSPEPNNDQYAIYKMLFDYEYYKNEARLSAQSSLIIGDDWVSMGEGDSRITRVNKNEVSKNFRALAKDSKEDLDKSVKMYLKYNAIPDQIVGDDTQGVRNYIIQEYNRTL